jgi:hypothetical protein
MSFFDPHHKMEIVQLFNHNLLWGKIRIEYDKLGSKEEGLRYANDMYEKIKAWDGEAMCASIDHEQVVKT